jgi:hypothetical protein
MKKNTSSSIEQSFVIVLPDGTAAIYDRPSIAAIQAGRENIPLTTAHADGTRIKHLGEIGMARPRGVLLPAPSAMDALDDAARMHLRILHDAGVAILTPALHAEHLLDVLGKNKAKESASAGQCSLFGTRGGPSDQQAFLTLEDSSAEFFPFNAQVESFIDFLYTEARHNVPYPQVLLADDASSPQGPWQSNAPDLKWQYAGKGGTGQL